MLVDAELDLAALDVGDGLGDVHGHGARLGVGHEATRAEDLTEATDLAHHVGGRDHGVEVQPATGDLLDQVVGADEVGTRGAGGLGLVGVGEDEDPGGLARAVGQVDGATDHLVSLTGVDPEAEGDLDGRVVLRRGRRLRETDGLKRAVHLARGHLVNGGPVGLAALHFCSFKTVVVQLELWSREPRSALPHTAYPGGMPCRRRPRVSNPRSGHPSSERCRR